MNFLYIYLILLAYFTLWFIIAQIKKNNGLIDVAWGFSFVVTATASLLLSQAFNLYKIILLAVVLIWGLRLSGYLLIRNWNKQEDFRYQKMKQKWKTNLKVKAFLKVFLTQSILSYLISMPIILTNLFSINTFEVTNLVILIIGVVIFLTGFIIEVLADSSLKKFKKNPLNKGKVITSGVWSISRHPNHFGEAMLWWGIGIISISSFTPIVFIGLIGPLLINLALRYVTGVPPLERRYKGVEAYEVYKSKTPIFVPFIKKTTKR